MASLTDRQREFVALGAAIGAGCQPCTQYHVRAALKAGLGQEEILRALDQAQTVRQQGHRCGRRREDVLGLGERFEAACATPRALVYIGSAAGATPAVC
jgi:AhpD family alkylhydroperoxidase